MKHTNTTSLLAHWQMSYKAFRDVKYQLSLRKH